MLCMRLLTFPIFSLATPQLGFEQIRASKAEPLDRVAAQGKAVQGSPWMALEKLTGSPPHHLFGTPARLLVVPLQYKHD